LKALIAAFGFTITLTIFSELIEMRCEQQTNIKERIANFFGFESLK